MNKGALGKAQSAERNYTYFESLKLYVNLFAVLNRLPVGKSLVDIYLCSKNNDIGNGKNNPDRTF